jgi:type I restriction enzyme S subunit
MSFEWKTVEISSICEGIFDGPHATPKKTESGPVFLGISSLNSGQLNLSDLEYLSEENFTKWTKRVTPQKGDLVFSYETRLGQIAIIPDGLRCCLGRRMALMRIDITKAIPEYVLYAYLAPQFQDEIRKRTIHGSTVDRIPLVGFGTFPISIPSLNTQKQIVGILKSIDDRITLLRETNTTLEAIAQALFKSWFVDFDPVHAKKQGREPEGMDANTAAFFPDSFEESELGLVPMGWRVQTLKDICNITSGKRPLERSDQQLPNAHIPLFGGAGIMGFTATSLFDEPKILTGRVGTLGKVHIAYPPFWASDNVLVLTPKEKHFFLYSFLWLKEVDVVALNRGSTQPLLTQKDLGNQKRVIPADSVLIAYEAISATIYKKIRGNGKQTQTLANLRDTLLPRLISGQLRLPDSTPA